MTNYGGGALIFYKSRLMAALCLGKPAKSFDDMGVCIAFEGNNQVKNMRQGNPLPTAEFRVVVGADVDIGIEAGEAGGDPVLFLSAEAAVPEFGNQTRRQFIAQGAIKNFEDVSLVGADFLAHFAEEGVVQIFAVIDAALRHLPCAGRVDAFTDEHFTFRIKQGNTHAGAIG